MTNVTSGRKPLKPFAFYDLDSRSWKTFQGSKAKNTSHEFSGTWPKSVTIVNMIALVQKASVPIIKENGSGYLPTPTASLAGSNRSPGSKKIRLTLESMARKNLWPTPESKLWSGAYENRETMLGYSNFCLDERQTKWWEVEPKVGRVVNGLANRVGELRAIGNGQVPKVVLFAWKCLFKRYLEGIENPF